MKSFREYILDEQKDAPTWHATKKDILEMWKNLRPGPLLMQPVPMGHKGSTFRMDGIRVTGSPQFINSVIARFKEILAYEDNPGTRLDVEYRQIETKGKNLGADSTPDYVFYVHVEENIKKAIRPTVKLAKPFETPKPLESLVLQRTARLRKSIS